MKRYLLAFVCAAACLALGIAMSHRAAPVPVQPPPTAGQRTFAFTYTAVVHALPPGEKLRIWIPLASSNADQDVVCLSHSPGARETIEPKYGNHLLYWDSAAGVDGAISVEARYRVTRFADHGDRDHAGQRDGGHSLFLQAASRVPVGGKALQLLAGRSIPSDPTAAAHLFYDIVDDHLSYRKDKPGWGFGDSDWACDSRFGNCTDFHSVFLSLARAHGIPAKFEIGFMLGAPGAGDVPGYHCWAKFAPDDHRWVPVDISEANQHPDQREANFGNICCNRVMFSVGRDITLVPRQAGAPINYLVYPYVEVNGKVWPQNKIEKHFSYRDEAPDTLAPNLHAL